MVIFHCFLYVYQRVSWFISTFGWLKPIKAHKTSQKIPLPLDSIQFHSIPIASPWNPIQFHWIPWNPMKSNEISWKSHEFFFKFWLVPWKTSLKSNFSLRPRWSVTPCRRCLRLQRHVASHAGLAETGLGGGRAETANETLGSIPNHQDSPLLWLFNQ